MRDIVLHYHILKNAGSTVRWILECNFPGMCGDVEGRNPWDTIDAERILAYARAHPELRVISTHQGRFPVPRDPEITFHPILFLRHPIDRAGSVYSFESRQPEDSPGPGAQFARVHDVAEYVKWRLAAGNGAVIRNFQTVFLSGREKDMRTAVADRRDLVIALERLQSLRFFGIVELFDDSVTHMRKFLWPKDLDVSYAVQHLDEPYGFQNATPGRKACLQDRLHDLKAALGLALYDELVEKNDLDLELYSAAVELFRARQASA